MDRNDYVSDVVEQSSLGYFPGASHWQGGQETVVLKNRGILSFIPNQLDGKDLSSLLHKEVYRDITNEGDIMSLPLGLHLQNMAYYNKKIYDQLKLKPPTSWPEFIEQAKIIKKAGYTPLALSQIRWQMRNILDSIMIGLKGAEFFKHIYDYKRPVDSLREDLIEVYELFLSLRQFTEKKHAKYKWFENINALANGEIAAYFLGDYSKYSAKNYTVFSTNFI